MTGIAPAFQSAAEAWIASVHDAVTEFFTQADQGGQFTEERWERAGGGGGVSRLMVEGRTFEKAGVNRSAVAGKLERSMALRLDLPALPPDDARFFATGISVVAHPRSPMIPTVHLNVRYFELTTPDGEVFDSWFGGGTDLTPTYPHHADAIHFHQTLAAVCARHDPSYYPRFKVWCDQYFRNLHRSNEARGVGGIFFDHLRPGLMGPTTLHAFADDIGRVLPEAYGVLVDRHRDTPYGEAERRLQLQRRGRYVEFNLLHDRGTSFGLQSGARTESVLMSMPPLARWDWEGEEDETGLARAIKEMLAPRNWAEMEVSAP